MGWLFLFILERYTDDYATWRRMAVNMRRPKSATPSRARHAAIALNRLAHDVDATDDQCFGAAAIGGLDSQRQNCRAWSVYR